MATLERQKPSASSAISFEEDLEEETYSIETDVKEEELILVELSNEPVEYDDNNKDDTLSDKPIVDDEPIENCLAPEVVQSLHSVKYVCLNVLDTLLQQVVKDLPIAQKERRLSDSSVDGSNNLLGSITQNTNLLLLANTSQPATTMIRSHSTPSTSISHVHRVLDSSQELLFNAGHDYTLCCSLATLLSDVYRMLEHCQYQQEAIEENIIIAQEKYKNTSLEDLFDTITQLRHERIAGLTKLVISNTSAKVIQLWNEMDELMDIVSRLAIQQQPPTYNELHSNNNTLLPPPAYEFEKENKQSMSDEKISFSSCPKSDLNELISAIDHLAAVAPRLNNQRAALTDRQVDELAASTLGKTVERLSRGRLEDQRAPLPAVISKHEMLHGLIHQIHTSASRSLDNQRVVPTIELQRKMDLASIHGLLDRLDRGRLMNQDSLSPEQLRLNDLMLTRDLLVKSLNRPAYHRQRYSMPANTKESHLLTNGLFCTERVECDQSEFNSNNSEDLHQLLDHVYKSKPQFDNQRATFNVDLQ